MGRKKIAQKRKRKQAVKKSEVARKKIMRQEDKATAATPEVAPEVPTPVEGIQ